MKNYIIYLHRNKINGKCYVGQTCQKPETRWGLNGNGYKQQEYFYRAIQKYGWDSFEHIILEENILENDVNERECYWGEYYNSLIPNGYNLALGNSGKRLNSEQISKNYSEATKLKWQNKEYREKVSTGRKEMWKNASEECKEKMLSNLDRSGKGAKSKRKQVLCIETGIIYESLREAERQTGISHTNISMVCNGKLKTAGKFHWQFVN